MQNNRLFLHIYLTQSDSACLTVNSAGPLRHVTNRGKSFAVPMLAIAVLFICFSYIPAAGQTNVFGPEKYTRSEGDPVAVTRSFTVSKPEGSFDLIVESIAGINDRVPINAVVNINGTEIVGANDSKKLRILKSITLKRENQISVQVNGKPSTSIVVRVSPSFKYILYTNPQETLLISGVSSDGRTIEYFGEKTPKGHAKAVTSMRVTTAKGESVEYFFNQKSRLAEIRSYTGLRLKFEWITDAAANVTITDAEGSSQVTTLIDFAKLASQSASSDSPCPECSRGSSGKSGIQRNHAQLSNVRPVTLETLKPFLNTNSASSAADVEEACLATARVLTKICDGLQAIQMGGITSQLLCAALAGAATATVYGAVLVPLIFSSCEVVMLGAELGCFALEASNQTGSTESMCGRVSSFFTGIKSFVLGKGVLVSDSLQISPSNTYSVGQTIGGSFSIVNRGRTTIVLQKVLIGGRVGGTCPGGRCPDFPSRTNIALAPGKAYTYFGNFTLPSAGTFTFSVVYQKTDGTWVSPVPSEHIAINQRSITVQQFLPKAIVSRSLTLSQPTGTYKIGQPITGTFTITNRGNSKLLMKRVLIGGRLEGTCVNNQCPDFNPVPSSITLAAGESYTYSGTFNPSRAGNYTFSVAYESSDEKWIIPVEAENGNKNQLNIRVASIEPNVVVSKSLTMAQGKGPFPVGQALNGSFGITNRGTGPVKMRQVLIGGRIGDKCPNDVCPDFSPVSRDVTLNPGQSLNYSGRFNLARAGSYTFYVAYETPDGKWEMPVRAENGAINRLSILVQPPGPVLTKVSPNSTAAGTNPQTINLYGLRLAKVLYAQLRLPSGKITYLYIPLNQVFRVNDEQMRISAKFPGRGTYYITVWTADGKSNEFPITIF